MRTERDAWSANGLLSIGLISLLLYLVIMNIYEAEFIFVIIFAIIIAILFAGLTIVKPNEAKTILLFGKYLGTIRQEGLVYTVPFTKRKRMSLKIQTIKTECSVQFFQRSMAVQLIVFYKIVDTAKVLYEVEQLEPFIQLQSETILKSILLNDDRVADDFSDLVSEEVTEQLTLLLQQKLTQLGIEIIDLYIVN